MHVCIVSDYIARVKVSQNGHFMLKNNSLGQVCPHLFLVTFCFLAGYNSTMQRIFFVRSFNVLSIIFLLACSLVAPLVVSAEEVTEGFLSYCPHYNSRSVRVDAVPQSPLFSQGTEARFSTTIHNTNTFPVTEGSLLVRIVDASRRVHDEFFVRLNEIVIPAQKSQNLDVSWSIPAFTNPGVYTAQFYFLSSGNFFLGGLPFVEGVYGGEARFAVGGVPVQTVSFEPSSVRVNGVLTKAGQDGVLDTQSAGNFSAVIKNTLSKKSDVLVAWKAFKGESFNEADIVASSIEKISLTPGVDFVSRFSLVHASSSAYRIVGEVLWMDTKSLIQAHVVRPHVSSGVFRLIGLSEFPSVKQDGAVVHGCIDSVISKNDTTHFPQSLKVSVVDAAGKVFSEKSYEVPLSRMNGFSYAIPSFKKYDHVVLVAELFSKEGVVQDSVHVSYDCEKFGACSRKGASQDMFFNILALVGGLLTALLFITFRKKKTPLPPAVPPTPPVPPLSLNS